MPKFSQKNDQTQTDSLESSNDKNVRFYFSPDQLRINNAYQNYEARLASYDEVMGAEFSDDEDDYSSICSSDFDMDELCNIGVNGHSLSDEVVNQMSETDAFNQHNKAYQHVMDDIQRAPERKALNQERSMLVTDLKGLQQISQYMETNYKTEKAKLYAKNNVVSSYFHSALPAQARFDSIAQIQTVIKGVSDDLENMKITPKTFTKTDPLMALKYQIHHLNQAILTIKGAVQKEYNAIHSSYYLQSSSNSALSIVLEKTFNCANMPEQEKVDSQSALDKFNAKAEMQARLEMNAETVLTA